MVSNCLLKNAKMPYKIACGSPMERHAKACKFVDDLYKEVYHDFAHNKMTIEKLQKHVDKICKNKINIKVIECDDPEFTGASDILYNDYGEIRGYTIEFQPQKGKLKHENIIDFIHEFQHIADQIFNPKHLARNQYLIQQDTYAGKYNKVYDRYLYHKEDFCGVKDKKKILKNIRHKIHNYLRGFNSGEKISILQDMRYGIESENNAYYTQAKYAKKLKKKYYPIAKDDAIKLNKDYMFNEKINLLKKMILEYIKKERCKHRLALKRAKESN